MAEKDVNTKDRYEKFYKVNDWDNQYIQVKYQLKCYLEIIEYTSIETRSIDRILDIGCGTGIYTKVFNDLGYNCTGVDFATAAIKKAKARFPNCPFFQHDAINIQLDKKFDLFFVSGFSPFNTLGFSEIAEILDNWGKLLSERGVIFVLGKTDLSGKESSSGWIFHTSEQIEKMYSHPDFSTTTFYAYSLLRYLVLFPFFKKTIIHMVNYFSEKIIAKIMKAPVRIMTVFVKK